MDAIKTLATPIARNNRAAAMINAGEIEAAISTICEALLTSRDMIEKAEETTHLPLHLTLDGLMTKCVHFDNSGDSQEQKTFMHRCAIHIDDTAEDTTCSYESRAVVSAVLIFNLALAYQLAAAKTTTGNDRYLKKAAKLYGLANRMGLVYQDLRDIVAAQKCFEHLLSTLMFLVDCGETDVVPDMDGFFLNTSHLVVTQASAAAA
jgi:hypothetical protein